MEQKVGNFGDAAGFSCMGGKILATSEGNTALAQAHHLAFTRWVDWMLAQP